MTAKTLRNYISQNRTLFGLSILFASLFALVCFGLYFTSSQFDVSLKPRGGLLDGLIANGISVIVSVILISPLTAYFVSMRRDQQLQSVRANFLQAFEREIGNLKHAYINHVALYNVSALTFQMITGDRIQLHAYKGMNERLQVMLNRVIHKIDSIDKCEPSGSDDQDRDATLKDILNDTEILRNLIIDIYERFMRETTMLDNTLLFSAPFFPERCAVLLYETRQDIIEYRYNLRSLLNVVSGSSDPGDEIAGKHAYLDFHKLETRLNEVGHIVRASITITRPTDDLETITPLSRQNQIVASTRIIDAFVKVRKFSSTTA